MSVAPAPTPLPANPPQEVVDWFAAQPARRAGMPALGTISAGLVVLARLRTDFSLELADQMTTSGGQVRGLNKSSLRAIFFEFDVDLPSAEEGGRTNRGNPEAVRGLLEALRKAGVDQMPEPQRAVAIEESLAFLVERIVEWHNRQRIEPKYDPAETTEVFIEQILAKAREKDVEGAVAQHLVGAALQLRFPSETIDNQRVSAADVQTKRGGDFEVGDTLVHVTVSPAELLIDKCARNLKDGAHPLLVTRANRVETARGLADDAGIAGRLVIRAVDTFVADAVDELAGYTRVRVAPTVRKLLELYNERVDAVEIDKSMLIELPPNV